MLNKTFKDKQLEDILNLLEAVKLENLLQIEEFGIQDYTLEWWSTILGEEYGELCKAIIEYYFEQGATLFQIYREAIQVATLALKIAEMSKAEYLIKEKEDKCRSKKKKANH